MPKYLLATLASGSLVLLSAATHAISDDGRRGALFDEEGPIARLVGITDDDFWEDDDADDASPTACSRRANNTPAKLLGCVTLQGVRTHQRALQDIANANGGTRLSGTRGYDQSVAYVRDQLLAAGYHVQVQDFVFTAFRPLGPSTLQQRAPVATTYLEGTDYALMSQTDPGTVEAAVTPVDLQLGLGNLSSSGCEPVDFAGFPAGHIALIQRGTCTFRQKAENAAAAGAIGAIIFNQGNDAGRLGLINGTLSSDYRGGIPVFFATYARGEEWASTAGLRLHMVANVFRGNVTTSNVLAETHTGRDDNVVMVGAHLDSVPEGPGIQDNGSGSAAILEIALQMHKVKPRNKVRFAWWGAEESGLVGSTFYVNSLTEAERNNIALYLNFDMIGSPNFARFIYDGDGSAFGLAGPPGSGGIERLFELFHSVQGLAYEPTEISFRSDYAAFFNSGIPFGGLFTGAEVLKTPAQQAIYGGTAGQAYDPCYHQACDTFENIDLGVLDLNSDGAALATLLYAYNTDSVKAPLPAAFAIQSRSRAPTLNPERWGEHWIR